jgi:hypothetical protein
VYSGHIEETLEKRVVSIISGELHRWLPKNHFLGYVIISDDEPLYTDPDKSAVLVRAHRFQFGELQFKGYRPLTLYRNGLLQIRFELAPGDARICWIDEKAVRIFMFEVDIAANPAAWKEVYRGNLLKGVSRTIGLIRAEEEKWSADIRQAIISGTVREGMTEEQAVAALGPPDEVSRELLEGEIEETVYLYKQDDTVYRKVRFRNGRVVRH